MKMMKKHTSNGFVSGQEYLKKCFNKWKDKNLIC